MISVNYSAILAIFIKTWNANFVLMSRLFNSI
jgi:hypothetical protein